MSLSKFHGGSSSSSATACAACKYQRKKCTENCILARYFPQEKQNQFLNAHKVFGVSNITKFIKGVEECYRDLAMNNLIFHANARARDPVWGVCKIMLDLKHKIACAQAELNLVQNQKLAMCQTIALQQEFDSCYSYGDLLEHGEEYLNIDGHVHQNQQEMMQKQSQMFMEMPIKLENRKISIPGHKNAVNQIPMPSQLI